MPITDEDAALLAITTLDPLSENQAKAKAEIDNLLASDDPFIDIHTLFAHYNTVYFRSLLQEKVEVSWSPRLTLCAGICELVRNPEDGNKFTKIRLKLSEPLLKFRSRNEVLDTLLHEMIHAYFFITTKWKHSRGEDGTGHGPGFLLLADAINDHGGYNVSVYHTFHDEVDSYRTHVWQCDGPCKSQAPFFGMVKRSMNRAPGKGDAWWSKHVEECGGTFTKVAEPELTKAQVERLSGLERAGRQRNKIEGWVLKTGNGDAAEKKRVWEDCDNEESGTGVVAIKKAKGDGSRLVACPICGNEVVEEEINGHLDVKHPP